jgi:hypothetical protein
VVAMTAADDAVCDLLRSDRADRCKQLAHADAATVYQSGTAALRRIVLAIDVGGATVIGPSVDVFSGDATLVSTTPTVRAVQIDGRPATVLDVVADYRAAGQTWQTESIVGCGQTVAGAWKCALLDVGRCSATVDAQGRVTTSCGDRLQLSLVTAPVVPARS